jgi:hypothetical protein
MALEMLSKWSNYIQAEKFPLLPLNPIAVSYPTEVIKMGKNRKEGANSWEPTKKKTLDRDR